MPWGPTSPKVPFGHIVISNSTRDMKTSTTSTNRNPYQEARRACRSIEDREALGKFIKAGWKENELSAFACLFLNPPTKYSYRTAIQLGVDHAKAQAFLTKFRDYVSEATLAPCPSPSRDPGMPQEQREAIETIARLLMRDSDSWRPYKSRDATAQIPEHQWKRARDALARHGTLQGTLDALGFTGSGWTLIPTQ